ncbi:hypothetical protein [Bacillus infantis]
MTNHTSLHTVILIRSEYLKAEAAAIQAAFLVSENVQVSGQYWYIIVRAS